MITDFLKICACSYLLLTANQFSIIEEITGKVLNATSDTDISLDLPEDGALSLWSWEDVAKTTLVNKEHNTKFIFGTEGV